MLLCILTGMLMIGRKWSDAKLFGLASAYEAAARNHIAPREQHSTMPKTEPREIIAACKGQGNDSRLESCSQCYMAEKSHDGLRFRCNIHRNVFVIFA